MKHFLLSVLSLFTLSTQAQTIPPKVAEMAKLYSTGDTIAVNKYGKLLGYGYPILGFPDIGNTYMYHHFIFSSEDTSRSKDYLIYTFGEHQPIFSNKLVSVEFGTNQQIIFDALVGELNSLGATGEVLKGADPGWIFYMYNEVRISTHINNSGNGHKYTISFGGGW